MKKIGILGGISSASTIDYYRKLMDLHYAKHHDYYYPEITIESLNFQYFTDLENTNAMEEYRAYILQGIRNLEAPFGFFGYQTPGKGAYDQYRGSSRP